MKNTDIWALKKSSKHGRFVSSNTLQEPGPQFSFKNTHGQNLKFILIVVNGKIWLYWTIDVTIKCLFNPSKGNSMVHVKKTMLDKTYKKWEILQTRLTF